MKFTLDEKVKHRLIGIAVILSIAAIFTPAMMKKNNQRLDAHSSLYVKSPERPALPKVEIPNEKASFDKVKVVTIDPPTLPKTSTELTLTQAEPLSIPLEKNKKNAVVSHVESTASEQKIVSLVEPISLGEKKKLSNAVEQPSKKPASLQQPRKNIQALTTEKKISPNKASSEMYRVKLGSFSKKQNADALIKKLRSKGYAVYSAKAPHPKGVVYQVFVGKGVTKIKAQQLQKKLVDNIQLSGLLVPVNNTLG